MQVQADTHTQRAMWLMVCSIADAYGFGSKQMQKFFSALQDNTDELERMALDGYGPETIAQATGYSISTTKEYMKQFFRDEPCERCSSKSICDAANGTCSRKERWKAIKEVPNGGR